MFGSERGHGLHDFGLEVAIVFVTIVLRKNGPNGRVKVSDFPEIAYDCRFGKPDDQWIVRKEKRKREKMRE